LFKEPAQAARIACVLLIVAGIVGLKVFTPAVGTAEPDAAADGRAR
jgi:hypothetical protein